MTRWESPGRLRRASAFVFVLLALGLGLGCAQAPASEKLSGSEAFERVVQRVEQVRGIRARRPIDARVVTPESLRDQIQAVLTAKRSPDEIARYLADYDRYSVPFYMLYRPHREPHLFGELLRKKAILAALEDSRPLAQLPMAAADTVFGAASVE